MKINHNIIRYGMVLRMVIFPILTLIHANGWVEPTISRAVTTAQSENRQLMLFFTSTSCQQCKPIEETIKLKEMEATFSDKYVVAIVDIESFDGKACSEIYQVYDVPSVVVVDQAGDIHYKTTGEVTTEDLKAILRNERTWDPASEKRIEKSMAGQHNASTVKKRPYALQIGFFSSKANAENLQDKAQQAGFDPVFVDVEERNNKPHYRVLVGGFDNESQASYNKDNLVASGFDVRIYKRTP